MHSEKPQRDWLQKIEHLGNKLPDITMLFIYALVVNNVSFPYSSK